jgi:molecular chaperone HscB
MVNYFELYQLPVSFHPDIAAVKSKYYELSRSFHPDRFAQATEHEKAEALRIAALNNDAYKILSNPDATMAYLLKLNELVEEEEKYNLPPDFLMEMLELNEAVSEYELEPDNEDMKKEATTMIAEQFSNWEYDVSPLLKRFDEGEQTKELLQQIKDYYFRRKYLLRIQQRINTFATH